MSTPYVDLTDIVETGGLYDTPASTLGRDELAAQIGREALHGSKDRKFPRSYRKNKERKPSRYSLELVQKR